MAKTIVAFDFQVDNNQWFVGIGMVSSKMLCSRRESLNNVRSVVMIM